MRDAESNPTDCAGPDDLTQCNRCRKKFAYNRLLISD